MTPPSVEAIRVSHDLRKLAKTRWWTYHAGADVRFFLSVRFEANGCWIWLRPPSSGGYPQFTVGARNFRGNRWVYRRVIGPIPEGLTLDHLCRDIRCVNPAHLEPVTMRENTLRGTSPVAMKARQTHCIRGHELSGDNLYIAPSSGDRQCRACAKWRRTGEIEKEL